MSEKSLYERLGGIYRITAVTDHFIDSLAEDPVVGKHTSNAYLKDWYENKSWRAPGFKVLNTPWICEKAGGPQAFVSTVPNDDSLDLEPTHYDMKITAEEFDAAGEVLANSLDHFDVPEREKMKYSKHSLHIKKRSLAEQLNNRISFKLLMAEPLHFWIRIGSSAIIVSKTFTKPRQMYIFSSIYIRYVEVEKERNELMYYIPVVPYWPYVPFYPCQQSYIPRQNAYESSLYPSEVSHLTDASGNAFVPSIHQNGRQNTGDQTTDSRSEHATEKSLYERLGGIYPIAAITDHFVDSLAEDPVVGTHTSNAYLRNWYENKRWRAAGFKVLNTLWICEKAGGPYEYVSTVPNGGSLDLEPTHDEMMITAEQFNAAANVLEHSLDHFNVPEREKNEVLEAFMAHKEEVISGTIKQ